MKKMNKKILIIVGLLIVVCGAIGSYFALKNNKPARLVYVTVEQGDSVENVIQKVVDSGVDVTSKALYKEFVSQDAKIYANCYELKTNMTPKEIVTILNNPTGNYQGDKLVVIEGDNLVNVAAKLAEKSAGRYTSDQIIAYWNDQDNIKKWMQSYWFLTEDVLSSDVLYPLEGYFAPATYPLVPDFDLETITTKMLDAMGANMQPYQEVSARQGLSINQFISLGSIVERETMHQEDRPKVAGVFFNRLEQNMPLGSDITVLYAMQQHKEIVTYADLEIDSPYNTYKVTGLTPGPIAMVSKSCLEAVSEPEDNDYLYFFAKQDTGEIIYSKTLEEHEKVSKENAWK